MARTPRPSEVYRLAGSRADAPLDPEPPPRRRAPLWLVVAGMLGVALIAAGVTRGTATTDSTVAPVVDVVSEDQAIAALALYGAEAKAVAALRDRADVYAGGGPAEASLVAAQGSQAVATALQAARALPNPDPLAARYYNDGGHAVVVEQLDAARGDADLIQLLSAAHDSVYAGTGAIPLPQAEQQLVGLFAGVRRSRPYAAWAQALLGQLDGGERTREAAAARASVKALWEAKVDQLQPAALDALRVYVGGLPPSTVSALRGHPVAGPALVDLERRGRDVSAGAATPARQSP